MLGRSFSHYVHESRDSERNGEGQHCSPLDGQAQDRKHSSCREREPPCRNPNGTRYFDKDCEGAGVRDFLAEHKKTVNPVWSSRLSPVEASTQGQSNNTGGLFEPPVVSVRGWTNTGPLLDCEVFSSDNVFAFIYNACLTLNS